MVTVRPPKKEVRVAGADVFSTDNGTTFEWWKTYGIAHSLGGSGYTDPALAIEAAWSWLNTEGGGELRLRGPGETWTVATQIDSQGASVTITSDWSLLLQASATLNANVLTITSHSNIVLDGLNIDANKSGGGVSADWLAISISDSSNIHIKNCKIDNAPRSVAGTNGHGIFISGGSDNLIENCWMDGHEWDGILIKENTNSKVLNCFISNSGNANIDVYADEGDNSNRVVVENCVSSGAGNWGIEIYRGGLDCHIINCIGLQDDKGFAIGVDTLNPNYRCSIRGCDVIQPVSDVCFHIQDDSMYNKIQDCLAYDSPQEGFRSTGDSNSITDCIAIDTLFYGIQLDGNDNLVDGCYLYDTGYGGNYYYGIRMQGNNNKVSDCYILSTKSCTNSTGGIQMDGDKGKVSDCWIEGYTSTDKNGNGIIVEGAGCKVSDCYIIDIDGNWSGDGIYVDNGDDTKIDNCTLDDCDRGIMLNDGDDVRIRNCDFVACTTPIDCNRAAAVRPMIMGCNWEGCTNDATTAGATDERITANIDKAGAWWSTGDGPS